LPKRLICLILAALVLMTVAAPTHLQAHNVSKRDARFVEATTGPAVAPFIYLGAKHMVTGYDHLAFLVGVIFFLYRMKEVVKYVSLFALGHSLTLLAGVLLNTRANPRIVDAIIGLSVVYKAFDNMNGFRRLFGFEPDTRAAVLFFGLCHGFGLATRLQELNLAKTGLLVNLVSFNVGVEIGQILALAVALIAFAWWRSRPGFLRHAFSANAVLMSVGFALAGYQLAGYYLGA